MTALVCDLGGTNARLGLVEDGLLLPNTVASLANDAFTDFTSLLGSYLVGLQKPDLDSICIALAAIPTPEGARLTNRDWDIRRDDVAAASGVSNVHFLNDFEALALSLRQADQHELQVLYQGTKSSRLGPRLVLGAGTGFNAAVCFPSRIGQASIVSAAECGHMTLPIEGEEELSLQAHLAAGRGRASMERALSGNGLVEIYNWCCRSNGRNLRFHKAAEISAEAVSHGDPDCQQSADLLLRLLGRVSGDLALAFLPTGGIFLSGGVTRSLAPLMRATSSTFQTAFRSKGRQSSFMESFPISLLLDDRAALAGCAEWLRSTGAAGASARLARNDEAT